jgi:O-antigen ligase
VVATRESLPSDPRAATLSATFLTSRFQSMGVPGVFVGVTVASLGLMNGGYFSTAWGWGSLGCLWIVATLLVVSRRVELGIREYAFLSLLGAFLAWTVASVAWSVSAPAAVRELERGLLLLTVLAGAMLLARHHMRPLLGGVLGGIVIACGYGLATRLFPSRLGSFSAIAGYRLDEPLGYWNAVGLFAAMGTLLALGFAARGRSVATRGFAAAAPMILLPTLYFTFSRGAWFAFFIGLAIGIAFDRRRLQLIVAVLALVPFAGLALWMCTREPDLNRRTAALAGATSEGRHLAFMLLVVAGVAAFVGPALQLAESRVRVGKRVRVAFAGLLSVVLLAAVGVAVVHYGGPQDLATRAYDGFKSSPVSVSSSENLNKRLFSLSSSGRLTQWGVAVDDYSAHPVFGSGAGTYELSWMKERPSGGWKVRDAHNLYLEVLAELGPVGLALLLLTFSIPIYAAFKVRWHPLVPIALGTYVAYLLHAAVDWDWEMPALTIAAFLCGVAILVVARKERDRRDLSRPVRIGAIAAATAVAAFSFVALMGNLQIAASNSAMGDSNWKSAAKHAGAAKMWLPWASDPWRLQGEAQYMLRQDAAARANFRTALNKDPNNWLIWADLATVSPDTWRADARRALKLNPLGPELTALKAALRSGG